MAVTLEGRQLTDAHQRAQQGIQRAVARDVLAVWRLLDASELDRSFPAYLAAVRAVLAGHKATSANVAAAYYRAFREAEGVPGSVSVRLAADLVSEQVATSMLVTGPVTAKRAISSGHPTDTAMRKALASTIGAASRLAAQGGRDTVMGTFVRDDAAQGVARVTRGDGCSFCAMLASRGPVYSKSTADFQAHDNCNCTTEVVYDRDRYDWPGGDRQRDLADLWQESTRGYSGKDAQNAFRRAYEARQRAAAAG